MGETEFACTTKAGTESFVICTIIAENYRAYARCLTESFLAHHPGGRVFVLLVGARESLSRFAGERFTMISVHDLRVPGLPELAQRLTVTELCTAVKPFFLEYLFEQYQVSKLCYFDPDIYFYDTVDWIFSLLDQYGVILIPHLLDFLDDEHLPNELRILQCGAYNLGFLGLARHPELHRLLHWWQQKLLKYCHVGLEEGLFVDQRWMDLVPSLFSSVLIHRDPGCNVAYWNLNHRHIEKKGGGYFVNDVPLRFFHFSGFSTQDVRAISRHQTRYTLDQLPELEPLFRSYRDELLAHGHVESEHARQALYSRLAAWLLRAGVGQAIQRVLGERLTARVRRQFLGKTETVELFRPAGEKR
jgi:hypothetical protein